MDKTDPGRLPRRRALARALPNTLSAFRIILSFAIIALVATDIWPLVSLILFGIAALTDFADGFLARRWSAQSAFGSQIDPLADKIMVVGVLAALYFAGRLSGLAQLFAGLIAARELLIAIYRYRGLWRGEALPADGQSKLKTVLQFIGIGFLLAANAFAAPRIAQAALPILAAAAAFGLISAYRFIRRLSRRAHAPAPPPGNRPT